MCVYVLSFAFDDWCFVGKFSLTCIYQHRIKDFFLLGLYSYGKFVKLLARQKDCLIFFTGWALYGHLIPWNSQELHQGNTNTKCNGVFKIIQHHGTEIIDYKCN